MPFSKIRELVPGFVVYCAIGSLLVFLSGFGLIPSEILAVYFGLGFILAGIVVPTGFHSDANGLYLITSVILSFIVWWVAIEAIRHTLDRFRGK